jgi:hypothetical protein
MPRGPGHRNLLEVCVLEVCVQMKQYLGIEGGVRHLTLGERAPRPAPNLLSLIEFHAEFTRADLDPPGLLALPAVRPSKVTINQYPDEDLIGATRGRRESTKANTREWL